MSIVLIVLFWLSVSQASLFHRDNVIHFAEKQYSKVVQQICVGLDYPTLGYPNDSKWQVCSAAQPDWTVGFFPGILWKLHQLTRDSNWKQLALKATQGLFQEQFYESSHDIGFMIMCSYGEAFKVTGDPSFANVIVNAASHLATRFNDQVGCIRSLGSKTDTEHFLVIADNMMNLPLLFEGYRLSGNQTWLHMAVSHANRTILEHLRADYSSYQVVDFDATSGRSVRKFTKQGYSDHSCWSRGEAWLLTGFTRAYHYTRMEHFLQTACSIADYFIAHLPKDLVPEWDFLVPKSLGYIPRDTSAAAIAAVGLFELYNLTRLTRYREVATKMTFALFEKYSATSQPLPALLSNSTIGGPNADQSRCDLCLSYTDYYFLQAVQYTIL